MCGIAGEIYADPQARPDPGLVARMCRSISYRGPDDTGSFVDGPLALGMVRLSIIDLEAGHQPISSEDGSVTVVFNGEIYNFKELRGLLEAKGHRFKTRSDTEVIVHLYEEHRERFVEHLRGMFAIALWDRTKRRLLLVRDRLGVKPLYYWADSRRLLFGSEIKAILQDPKVLRTPDFKGLDQMMRYGYTAPPTTCFDGIRELPPASILSYEQGRVQVHPYWDLRFEAANTYDEANSREELRALLREAVRLRMRSDVPLGALLSGGIDSALVVAMMSELSDEPVKTFSIGFEDQRFSELPSARQLSTHHGTDHHEHIVTPQIIGLLPTLIRHHDAPFYDASAIPTYYVCQMAREHVTVALSGDGGDELFAGYNLYLADKAAEYYGKIPTWLRNGVLSPVANWIPESDHYVNIGRVAREFVRAGSLRREERHERWTSKVKRETRQRLYRASPLLDQLSDEVPHHLERFFRAQPLTSGLNQMLYVDLKTLLANQILPKVDRMSMAHSLEVRSPLLDHKLHEFAATLPECAKLRRRTTKYLLRSLASDYIPADLLKRPKRGFMVPLDRWFREDLSDYVREILFDPGTRSRGLFHQDAVEDLIERHMTGRGRFGREIWMLLVTELWHRIYIDEFQAIPPQDNSA